VSTYVLFALTALVLGGLAFWSSAAARKRRQLEQSEREKLGFGPCDDETNLLEQIVARIENNRAHRYEVRRPMRLRTANRGDERRIYHYTKVRHGDAGDAPFSEQELLVPWKRRSTGGLVLTVKPTALAHGLATRLIGAVASRPGDGQPDDLQRLEIPVDLKNGNLVAALGSPAASLYDLLDSSQLKVVEELGNAGGMTVRFRDEWCSISGVGAHRMPFQLDRLLPHLQPLLPEVD
jgi:hypothetical protein